MPMSPRSESEPFVEAKEQTKIPIMLGFFDVLGFSKRVETEGPEQIAALYNELISTTVKKEKDRCLGSVRMDDGNRYMALFSLEVRHAYFSDTILLWAPMVPMFAGPFIGHCCTFVCEALALNVPIRGAIAQGEAIMHRPSGTYIGMPIVEGASVEKAQEWLGVAFAESATWSEFMAELNPTSIIEYDIPVKPGTREPLPPVALDWPRRWQELYGSSPVARLQELNERSPHPKIENAMRFAEHCAANKDWHRKPAHEREGARLIMNKSSNPAVERDAPQAARPSP